MRSCKIIYIVLLVIGLFSCKSNVEKETMVNKIKNLEDKVYSDSTKSVSPSAGNDLAMIYAKYVDKYPTDTASAEYLFRAAELSRSLNNAKQAVVYYDMIALKYPNYRKVALCFFLEGFVYENQMNDIINARKYYTLFINKYPTHPLVKDTKILIENLGKSPEDFIKDIEEQNANNTKPI